MFFLTQPYASKPKKICLVYAKIFVVLMKKLSHGSQKWYRYHAGLLMSVKFDTIVMGKRIGTNKKIQEYNKDADSNILNQAIESPAEQCYNVAHERKKEN